jgi:hypothetical protein
MVSHRSEAHRHIQTNDTRFKKIASFAYERVPARFSSHFVAQDVVILCRCVHCVSPLSNFSNVWQIFVLNTCATRHLLTPHSRCFSRDTSNRRMLITRSSQAEHTLVMLVLAQSVNILKFCATSHFWKTSNVCRCSFWISKTKNTATTWDLYLPFRFITIIMHYNKPGT